MLNTMEHQRLHCTVKLWKGAAAAAAVVAAATQQQQFGWRLKHFCLIHDFAFKQHLNIYFLHKTLNVKSKTGRNKTGWNSNCLRKKGVAQESGPCNGGGGCHDSWILNQGLGSIAGRALPCGCCVGVRLGLDVHSSAWHRAGRYCHCGWPQVEPWTWQVWVFIGGQVFVNEAKTVCWRYFLGDITFF